MMNFINLPFRAIFLILGYFSIVIQLSEAIIATPELIAVVLSDDASYVLVTFDNPTNKGASSSDSFVCTSLFSFTGDSDATCAWKDASTIQINPDFSPAHIADALNVGSFVKFKDGTNVYNSQCDVNNLSLDCQPVSSQNLFVRGPSNPVTPVIAIAVETFGKGSSNFKVDFTGCTGDGGRGWSRIEIKVKSNNVDDNSGLATYLENNFDSKSVMDVSTSYIKENTVYTLSVMLCNVLSICQTGSTEFSTIVVATYGIKTFYNGDLTGSDNPFSNLEVHCFKLNDKGEPTYVRGTYGQRGYFEGPVSSFKALVNFQEVAYLNLNGLTPTAGAGVLEYNADFSYKSGVFWASGSASNLTLSGVSDWGISGECSDSLHSCTGAPSSFSEADIVLQYCFWNVTKPKGIEGKNIATKPWQVLGSINPNTWYALGVGFGELGGATVGAYRYTYSTEECKGNPEYKGCKNGRVEWGIYSQETVVSGFNNSVVLSTEWRATSGPISGQSGSALYAIFMRKDKSVRQIGFFCNSKMNADPNIPAKKVLTSCSYDSNNELQADTAANRKLAQSLLKSYTKKEYTNWWQSLSLFVRTIWNNQS